MIRIDLGKDAIGDSEKERGRGIPILGSLAGSFSFLGLLFGSLVLAFVPAVFLKQFKAQVQKTHETKMENYRQELGGYKREIAALIPFQGELKSYEEQKKAVSERLGVMQGLLYLRKTPVPLLDAMGQSLSKRTWIESLEIKFVEDESIKLRGNAFANEEISDYVDKLSDSIYLSDVSLAAVSTKKVNGQVDVKNFEVKARVGKEAQIP